MDFDAPFNLEGTLNTPPPQQPAPASFGVDVAGAGVPLDNPHVTAGPTSAEKPADVLAPAPSVQHAPAHAPASAPAATMLPPSPPSYRLGWVVAAVVIAYLWNRGAK